MRYLAKLKTTISQLRTQGAFHIFVGTFISKFVSFFGSALLVRLFTKAEYGVLGYVENLFGYSYLFAGLGLTYAMFRFVIKAKTPEQQKAYYDYIIRRSTVYNVIIAIIGGVVFALLYPHSNEFSRTVYLLPILMLSLPLHSLSDSGLACLRSMFATKDYAVFACISGILLIGIKCILAAIVGLNGVFFAHIAAYGICACIMMTLIKRRYFSKLSTVPTLTITQVKEVNIYAVQYMITNGIWALFMLNDLFLLGRLTGNSDAVANYKVAYVIPSCFSLFSASIGVFISPYFVKHEDDHRWVRKNYFKTLLVSVTIIGIAAIIIIIAAKPIIWLLYGKEYLDVIPLMRILLIAAFLNNAIRYTAANLLAAMGRIRANMIISICGIALQIVMNLIIAPRFAEYGIAWTSVFVYSAMAVAVTVAFLHWYRPHALKETE